MPTEDLSGSNALWFPAAPGISSVGAVSLPKTAVYATDEDGNQVLVRYDVTVSKLVPVWNQSTRLEAPLKIGVTVGSLPYAVTNTAAAVTLKTLVKMTLPMGPSRVSGTLAPVLGAGQVSPTSTATNAGWTLAYNSTDDEANTTVSGFGFDFTLNNVAYTSCYVNSNAYITFGASALVYQTLNASSPAQPKLHVGSGDWSYQRIYTKASSGVFRIRWEGNSAYDAAAGSSNRFHEVTFYAPAADGTQLLEVRSGNISGGTSGPLMLATASTALATGTFAANESWVFEGNSTGTTWNVYAGSHVEVP